jgi:N-acetylneuraminic acid mutarotase
VTARLPTGLRYAGAALLSGRIYVAGGVATSGESNAVYAIDPRGGTVSQIATLPTPVAHAPLVALGRFLYLVGGTDAAGGPLASILRIDPAAGTVARAGSLPGPLADAAATRVGRRIVVLGGTGSAPSSAVVELRLD